MKKCLLANIADFTQINEVSSSTIPRRHLLNCNETPTTYREYPKSALHLHSTEKKKEMMPIYNSATTHTCLEFLLVDI